MIEQTALETTIWNYTPYPSPIEETQLIPNVISLEVQKKRNSQKKGIALRFTTKFTYEDHLILEFSGEHSYVIDFNEDIDRAELRKMIRNSYQMFKDAFDFKKLNTTLNQRELQQFKDSEVNMDGILPMLI
tara:strand:- start:34687 stop:35079 length:393 start_codon:yes stop_codon:yes gene_type:complete